MPIFDFEYDFDFLHTNSKFNVEDYLNLDSNGSGDDGSQSENVDLSDTILTEDLLDKIVAEFDLMEVLHNEQLALKGNEINQFGDETDLNEETEMVDCEIVPYDDNAVYLDDMYSFYKYYLMADIMA